ncbi:MAG: hypothetical protein ACI8TX_003511 [Hyphomicrobiaceae bacterium]|jgi:hypothetical protein
MARKPNYSYERHMRDKAKNEKKEAKRLAKEAAKAEKAGVPDGTVAVDPTLEVVEAVAPATPVPDSGQDAAADGAAENSDETSDDDTSAAGV